MFDLTRLLGVVTILTCTQVGTSYAASTGTPSAAWPFKSVAGTTATAVSDYLKQFEDQTLAFCLEHAERGNSDAHYCAARKLRARSEKGDAEAVFAHLRAAAEAGNPFAQNDLGDAYFGGKVVGRDYKTALYWFTRSAEWGVSNAMVSIGWQYMCGLGVAIDYAKARTWNQKGAELDRAEGANNLGWLFEHGLGGPREEEAALVMYAKGAELGSKEAGERLRNLQMPTVRWPLINDCGQ